MGDLNLNGRGQNYSLQPMAPSRPQGGFVYNIANPSGSGCHKVKVIAGRAFLEALGESPSSLF